MGIRYAHMKSALGHALDAFLAAFGVLFVCVFAYGFVTYPDAPIRRCGADQFCGKSNKPHSEQEFKDFTNWESMLVLSFASAFVAGYVLQRRRRRSAAQDLELLLATQPNLVPAVEEQRYAAAWKDRRRRKVAALALSLLALSAVILRANGGLPAAPLAVALVAMALGSLVWFNLFACPRCRHEFLSRQSVGRCQFCGLRLGTTFEEALTELKEDRS